MPTLSSKPHKNQPQTYVCTNDGKSYYLIGHVEIENHSIPELEGKAGAYAWLEEDGESIYNHGFSK